MDLCERSLCLAFSLNRQLLAGHLLVIPLTSKGCFIGYIMMVKFSQRTGHDNIKWLICFSAPVFVTLQVPGESRAAFLLLWEIILSRICDHTPEQVPKGGKYARCPPRQQEVGQNAAASHLKDPKPYIDPELVFSAIPLFPEPRISECWKNFKSCSSSHSFFRLRFRLPDTQAS